MLCLLALGCTKEAMETYVMTPTVNIVKEEPAATDPVITTETSTSTVHFIESSIAVDVNEDGDLLDEILITKYLESTYSDGVFVEQNEVDRITEVLSDNFDLNLINGYYEAVYVEYPFNTSLNRSIDDGPLKHYYLFENGVLVSRFGYISTGGTYQDDNWENLGTIVNNNSNGLYIEVCNSYNQCSISMYEKVNSLPDEFTNTPIETEDNEDPSGEVDEDVQRNVSPILSRRHLPFDFISQRRSYPPSNWTSTLRPILHELPDGLVRVANLIRTRGFIQTDEPNWAYSPNRGGPLVGGYRASAVMYFVSIYSGDEFVGMYIQTYGSDTPGPNYNFGSWPGQYREYFMVSDYSSYLEFELDIFSHLLEFYNTYEGN